MGEDTKIEWAQMAGVTKRSMPPIPADLLIRQFPSPSGRA